MSAEATKKDPERYHHGDLRRALIAVALGEIEATGAEALSLRACARGVGVDPAAAYRHFRDKGAVLAAVAEAGAGELLEVCRVSTSAGLGVDRVVGLARAYVAFAVARPHLFRLIFGPQGAIDHQRFPPLACALDVVVSDGRMSAEQRQGADVVLWAAIHGLAMLAVDGLIPVGADTLVPRCDRVCLTVLEGLGAIL